MEQVLINLLHNVCNYTPPGSPVEIGAKIANGWLWLTVADRGLGYFSGGAIETHL